MDVSKNSGTPKSSISIGFSLINHPFWGTPIFGNIHIRRCILGILAEIEATLGVDAFDQAIRSKVRQEKVWKYCRMGGLVRQI